MPMADDELAKQNERNTTCHFLIEKTKLATFGHPGALGSSNSTPSRVLTVSLQLCGLGDGVAKACGLRDVPGEQEPSP